MKPGIAMIIKVAPPPPRSTKAKPVTPEIFSINQWKSVYILNLVLDGPQMEQTP